MNSKHTPPAISRRPTGSSARTTSARKIRTLAGSGLWWAASVALAAATLGGLGVAGSLTTTSQNSLPFSTDALAPAAAVPDEPPTGNLIVAVALGTSGTVATDAMGPYEVFGRSSRFTVYTVAEKPGPAPVEGAPAILPDHTFAEVDTRAELAPDVVVVPAVTDPTSDTEQPLRDWVVRQHQRGAHILSVCAGAMVMAETGLLDGRTATSHWSRLSGLRTDHPETDWVSGQRFVSDGDITTTAGITSGIPGALSVVHDLAGAAEARRVGDEVGYPGWAPDGSTAIPVQSWSFADRPVILNALLPWLRPTIAVELADGVGEIDTASLFEVYTNSAAARAFAVSPAGIVETAHGLRLLTLTDQEAPDVDTTLHPGVTGSSHRAGFDGALEHLADTAGRGTARAAAKMIDYPVGNLDLGAEPGPHRTPVLAVLAILTAVLLGLSPLALRRRLRTVRGTA